MSGHCDSVSAQGNVCAREAGHIGCHEVYVEGDGRRWWGDARWAPWQWIVYAWGMESDRAADRAGGGER